MESNNEARTGNKFYSRLLFMSYFLDSSLTTFQNILNAIAFAKVDKYLQTRETIKEVSDQTLTTLNTVRAV